ncbi:MAG: hypothetical protein OXG97_01105 [Candidatus Poribacteria bacterium]|nr:hypothetical protein [Candidatus Poribacteria bacterium]
MRKKPPHSARWVDRILPRVNRFLTVALIITFIGLGAFWIYLRASSPLPMIPKNNISELSAPPREEAETPQMPQGKLIAETFKEVFTAEELASPEMQKLLKTLDSPAYEAFIETDPSSIGDYFDFFQLHGLSVDKNEVFAIFKDSMPSASLVVLEQRKRSELSTLLRENPIEIGTPAGLDLFQDVITEFLSKEDNVSWMMTHFQGDYMAFGEWTAEVLRNPTPLPEETPAVVNSNTAPLSRDSEADINSSTPLDSAEIDEMSSITISSARSVGVRRVRKRLIASLERSSRVMEKAKHRRSYKRTLPEKSALSRSAINLTQTSS